MIPSTMKVTKSSFGYKESASNQPDDLKDVGVCRNTLDQSGWTEMGITGDGGGRGDTTSMTKIQRSIWIPVVERGMKMSGLG